MTGFAPASAGGGVNQIVCRRPGGDFVGSRGRPPGRPGWRFTRRQKVVADA